MSCWPLNPIILKKPAEINHILLDAPHLQIKDQQSQCSIPSLHLTITINHDDDQLIMPMNKMQENNNDSNKWRLLWIYTLTFDKGEINNLRLLCKKSNLYEKGTCEQATQSTTVKIEHVHCKSSSKPPRIYVHNFMS